MLKHFIEMKIPIILITITFAVVYVNCQPLNDNYAKEVAECRKQVGLPDDHKASIEFVDQKDKCFVACVMEKQKMMVNGKVDFKDGNFFPTKNSPDKESEVKEILRTCTDAANQKTDKCEVAATALKCMEDKGGELFSGEN